MKLARRTTKSNAYRYILNAASVCALAIQEPLNWIKTELEQLNIMDPKSLHCPGPFQALRIFLPCYVFIGGYMKIPSNRQTWIKNEKKLKSRVT